MVCVWCTNEAFNGLVYVGSNENVISKQQILKDVEGYPDGLD